MASVLARNAKYTLLLISAFVFSAAALVAEGEIKRTASGKPDLTGTYDAATLTPLERPEEFGDNLYLSQDEADAIVKRQADRVAERSQVSSPDREAPPVGGQEFFIRNDHGFLPRLQFPVEPFNQ